MQLFEVITTSQQNHLEKWVDKRKVTNTLSLYLKYHSVTLLTLVLYPKYTNRPNSISHK